MRALITLTLKTAAARFSDKTILFRSPENRSLNICVIVACTFSENVGCYSGQTWNLLYSFSRPKNGTTFCLLSPSPRPLQPANITGSVSDHLGCEVGGGRSSDTRNVPDRASDPGRR